ncbi:MAG: YafY family transcriptional regulator [Rhodoferax sp.]|uniref:helix-turn-helix transcriptional regulator n=1 Tax=Rhodoferax sp. TaxID=50421 RepID=UPI001400DA0F|nr:YafY family protein [Rhodoferax sp.]NDP38323.1 YafY family transcriptional regulator [Rhodoferax sp.]
MDRTERFYMILGLLRRQTVVSFATLQTALEVSRSTLKRDLSYLSTRLNNPIAYSRELGGYSLEKADGESGIPHELPGLWFSATEIHALLTVQHLLSGLDTGGLLNTHIAPFIDRLNTLLGHEGNEDATQLRRRVRIIGLAHRSVTPRHFERVATALAQRKRLHIAYCARGTGEASAREVSPLRLVHYRGNWYLDAWCHLRQGLRNFALDAMAEVQLLDRPARDVSDAKLDATFGSGYGIFSSGTLRWARLRFTPERARWVAQEQWHPQQDGKHQADGGYLLRIPYTDHRELIMDILKHGAHCEVLGPTSLRQVVGDEVKKMGEKYF